MSSQKKVCFQPTLFFREALAEDRLKNAMLTGYFTGPMFNFSRMSKTLEQLFDRKDIRVNIPTIHFYMFSLHDLMQTFQDVISDFLKLEKDEECTRETWRKKISDARHEVDLVTLVFHACHTMLMQVEVKSGSQDDAIGQMKHFCNYVVRVLGEHLQNCQFRPIIAMTAMEQSEGLCQCKAKPFQGETKFKKKFMCCPKPKSGCDFFKWTDGTAINVSNIEVDAEADSICHCRKNTEKHTMDTKNTKKRNKDTKASSKSFAYCAQHQCEFFQWMKTDGASRPSEEEEGQKKTQHKQKEKTSKTSKNNTTCCARYYLTHKDLENRNLLVKLMTETSSSHQCWEGESVQQSGIGLLRQLIILSSMVFTSLPSFSKDIEQLQMILLR